MSVRYMKRFSPKTILFGTLALGLISFVGYNTRDLFLGAPLSLRIVKDGSTVASPYLPIEGNAKHAKQVHINGRPVQLDQNGNFSDGVMLSPGYNIVTISQEDRFGNQKEKILHVVAEESPEKQNELDIHYQEKE